MVSAKRQILGIILVLIGFIGTAFICAWPAWKVSVPIISNNLRARIPQILWQGLWKACLVHSYGHMQCKVYDSEPGLPIPQDLQAAQALVVISLVVGSFGIILATCFWKCTNFIGDVNSKAKVAIASGVLFIISGLMVLIPMCWTTDEIVKDFYISTIYSGDWRRELGASIYVGWGCAAALFLGGGLLCSSCPANEDSEHAVTYTAANTARAVDSSEAFV